MRLPRSSAFLVRASLLTATLVLLPVSDASAQEHQVLSGRDLFQRRWQAKDPLCPQGDGLGPLFNAVSCVSCHHQAGSGGGGDNNFNVDLLTLRTEPGKTRAAAKGDGNTEQLVLPPAFFEQQATVVLHRFGVQSAYEPYRFRLLGENYSHDMTPVERARFWASIAKTERRSPAVREIRVGQINFALSQRNTPALFGAGLIDGIDADQIRAIEQQQAAAGTTISGRVAPAKPSRRNPFAHVEDAPNDEEVIGRFGWRGQVATLADFVLGACANELGLETPGHDQPVDVLAAVPAPSGLDLDEEQCRDLIEFVRLLPRPQQIQPLDSRVAQRIEQGEKLFHRVGCGTCHVKTVGAVEGLYSDLLLHDMGRALADPVPALPEIKVVAQGEVKFAYFGGVVDVLAEVPSNLEQEWRTPPLWGVADSAPYLHDGRAETLHQAIALHGGEADESRKDFASLSGIEQESLVMFLMTLRAPRSSSSTLRAAHSW